MELKHYLLIAHIIGVGLSLGGATVSDIFFLRILRNKVLTDPDYANLRVLSRIVWTGLILLIVSGIAFLWLMYSEDKEMPGILRSAKFQTKLIMVGVVTLNGLVFHFYVFRRLKEMIDAKRALRSKTWLFAITGAISITSWYGIVIISIMRGVTLPFLSWISIYVALVILAALTAHFVISRLLRED